MVDINEEDKIYIINCILSVSVIVLIYQISFVSWILIFMVWLRVISTCPVTDSRTGLLVSGTLNAMACLHRANWLQHSGLTPHTTTVYPKKHLSVVNQRQILLTAGFPYQMWPWPWFKISKTNRGVLYSLFSCQFEYLIHLYSAFKSIENINI